MGAECPRCGSSMVERRNRDTGEPFLGCSRYPSCRGTRPLATAPLSPKSRPRPSHGGRPKGWGDDAELLVARVVGRSLKPWEGCLVQLAALAIVGGFLTWLFWSGTFSALIQPLVDWYTTQIVHLGPTPSPSG